MRRSPSSCGVSSIRDDDLSIAVVGSDVPPRNGVGVCRRNLPESCIPRYTSLAAWHEAFDSVRASIPPLESGGRTVAVLGRSDVIYPKEHHRSAERIASRGAVVTEFALATLLYPPLPKKKPSDFGHVPGDGGHQAAERNGSLITARSAADQNRRCSGCPDHSALPTAAASIA